jgi:hypothetical protein
MLASGCSGAKWDINQALRPAVGIIPSALLSGHRRVNKHSCGRGGASAEPADIRDSRQACAFPAAPVPDLPRQT